MAKKNAIVAAVASFGLTAFGAAAQADTTIAPSSTSYQYTAYTTTGLQTNVTIGASPTINFADGDYSNANDGNNVANSQFYTQYSTEQNRLSSPGIGTLNDGLVGDQTYLNSGTASHSAYNGGINSTPPAYQVEGGLGQTGANGQQNIAGSGSVWAKNESAYYGSNMALVFNLGANYTNLSTVTIYGDWDQTTNWSQFQNIQITDGKGDVVNSTQVSGNNGNPPSTVTSQGTQYLAQGLYFADTIDISALSGQFITLGFYNIADQFAPLNEIQFATTGAAVPEPASLSLLSIGALGLMRRRGRRVR